MKFIDLSIPIINPEEAIFDPPLTTPHIEYSDHDTGAEQIGFVFPKIKPEHLPDGKGWAVENINLGTHSGTHMDAPLHFIAKGKGIDRMPFDATIGPARVLEIKDKECIKIQELKRHHIKIGERILFKTRNSSYWKNGTFNKNYVYISLEAAKYLASLKVRLIGVDYLSVGGKDGIETHKILLKTGIWIIEGLDLSKVKPASYDLICLPLKILNSDGAPARAIIRYRR